MFLVGLYYVKIPCTLPAAFPPFWACGSLDAALLLLIAALPYASLVQGYAIRFLRKLRWLVGQKPSLFGFRKPNLTQIQLGIARVLSSSFTRDGIGELHIDAGAQLAGGLKGA
jgi:hypothetical protein